MSQKGSDLFQCGATPQHQGCRCVAEEIRAMGWGIPDVGTSKCGTNDAGNDASLLDGAEWRLCTEKYAINRDLWASMFYVVQNRIAGVLR
jgi:hypothetical protein